MYELLYLRAENGLRHRYLKQKANNKFQGLILRANEAFTDTSAGVERSPGDKWMIRGPTEYVPPVEVEVVTQRAAIPLDENEGIYVRDIKTGRVRAIIGETYMLTQVSPFIVLYTFCRYTCNALRNSCASSSVPD